MSKKGGVTAEEYKEYDAGTSIFTKDQNLAAFAAGSTPANLNFQAEQIAQFLVDTGLAPTKPSLDGLFNDSFVKATTG
jgi:NitT/TauT family transport system substrate-binding protein